MERAATVLAHLLNGTALLHTREPGDSFVTRPPWPTGEGGQLTASIPRIPLVCDYCPAVASKAEAAMALALLVDRADLRQDGIRLCIKLLAARKISLTCVWRIADSARISNSPHIATKETMALR